MKTLLLISILFGSLISSSQIVAQSPNDTVNITLSVQARDLEFIASALFDKPEMEDVYDSTKIRFRTGESPTGNTPVSITAYARDWFAIYIALLNNELAWHSGTKSRLEALLTTAGGTYAFVLDKLTALNDYLKNSFQQARQQGRQKLRRNNKL